ncbi:hypothetical protein ACFV0T_31240 [Streptomyces sp. NPDC059582]|uniref:hypothetical protein n=1 Tax=Streptomyces sp. NPDC059582 TaxID=3346875 RepID=UPI00367B4785
MSGGLRIPLLAAVLAALFVLPPAGAAAADGPAVQLSTAQAGTGGSITVSGSGWRSHTLLMVLICGRSAPSRGVLGGTNSCANADGRAVTTDAKGGFSRKLPVTEPPVPCPCVVHVATVTGAKAQADAVFQVAGHAVEPLPAQSAGGRLSVLTDTRLDGSGGVLTWFGAPPARTLVFTVGNVGSEAVTNPVFRVGTSHGVFAPQWDERQWRGSVAPGRKARIRLPVELAAGAHGDYTVSLEYGGRVLAEQPWGVGRPWGVTLFWLLVCLVGPAAVFRVGMAVVDHVRPRRSRGQRGTRGLRGRRFGRASPRLPLTLPGLRAGARGPGTAESAAEATKATRNTKTTQHGETTSSPTTTTTSTLPWFTPDSFPGTAGRLSAPHHDSPTSPTTPTRKGPT